ncbi:hypothetical protein J8273_1238 [Carpediemonas membranifera]|uniref:Uncharacterized protein n=1 Tax=Carpediemonas membranifera TaxID=201153 RepID=A0A8J6B7N8_9EUKA|nr:hypothetical protein J8273_1238 [Carpediemonas membranifera]|eukprot:KAG9397323.1 hypothetical protein J8273_1238 [Carpediemonas membranifera]
MEVQNSNVSILDLPQNIQWHLLVSCGVSPDTNTVSTPLWPHCDVDYLEYDGVSADTDALPFLSTAIWGKHKAVCDSEAVRHGFTEGRDPISLRLFDGRVFTMSHDTLLDEPVSFSRLRIPRARALYTNDGSLFIATERGFYAQGSNSCGQLGLGQTTAIVDSPSRVSFPDAPEVAELEASRLLFERHAVIEHVFLHADMTIIQTSVGLFGAGSNANGQLGVGDEACVNTFRPIRLPPPQPGAPFMPTAFPTATIFTRTGADGRVLRYVTGRNRTGQLGLGHTDPVTTPARVPGEWAGVHRAAASPSSCATAASSRAASPGSLRASPASTTASTPRRCR